MSEADFLFQELYRRYGSVKRARGCFLYTAKGTRLTDLYQEDGRAILGWGGGSSFTMLKDALSRGATGSYRTDFSYRLQKAVCDLVGDDRIVIPFYDKKKMLSLALAISPEGTSVYRPWAPAASDLQSVVSLAIAPPLAWAQPLWLLAVKRTDVTEAALSLALGASAAGAARIPSPLEAAYARSLYDLMRALQSRSEKDWFLYDSVLSRYWTRKGPYLYPRVEKERYAAFVEHCLDCAVVVNPVHGQPSIVPFGADPGVFSLLKKNPFDGESHGQN